MCFRVGVSDTDLGAVILFAVGVGLLDITTCTCQRRAGLASAGRRSRVASCWLRVPSGAGQAPGPRPCVPQRGSVLALRTNSLISSGTFVTSRLHVTSTCMTFSCPIRGFWVIACGLSACSWKRANHGQSASPGTTEGRQGEAQALRLFSSQPSWLPLC